MNLHQFKFVQEAVRRDLNLTEVAKALKTSQPGVSKSILELEAELGVEIFLRHGKRIKRLTEPGREVLKSVEVIMRELANLRRIGHEYSAQDHGTLSIAATHTQARYVLPQAVVRLRELYPQVAVSLHQGTPEQVARMLQDDIAEVGIATESLADYSDLITLPCYDWQHVIVVPPEHPLAKVKKLGLEDIVDYPLITYHPSFTGRSRVDAAFAQRKLKPNVVLEAIDSDVIKTYVGLGLGIGIVAEMSMGADDNLVVFPGKPLFGTNTTRIAFKRGAYLREFVYQFTSFVNDHLDRTLIEQVMQNKMAVPISEVNG